MRRILIIVLWLLASSCLDGETAARHAGGRGFPCYFPQDCSAPMTCQQLPSAPTPVCSGSVEPDQLCQEDHDCLWLRDARGLPLRCEAGRCAFHESL